MKDIRDFGTMERAMMAQAIANRSPINGSMELLPLCNMNCDMCYVRLSRTEMEAKGRLRTGKEWLALGREMAKAGTLFLLLTGGEPLLHPDFKEIYLGLKKLGMILTINTNATLIDEEWAAFFGKHKPRRINITLYGSDNKTYEELCHYPGGYDRVIKAVKLLKEQGVDIRLGCSMTQTNVGDMGHVFAIAGELDVPMIADAYMMPGVRERNRPFNEQSRLLPEEAAATDLKEIRLEHGEEYFAAYCEEAIKQIDAFVPGEKKPCEGHCLAGQCSFTINWQGMMRPCVLSTEPTVPVFELGFAESWKQVSEGFGQIKYCSECSVCRLKPICQVCAVAARAETGDYGKKPEYLCRYAAEKERLIRKYREEKHA